MSRVLVWRSDADGRLFEDYKKYRAHLARLSRARRAEAKRLLEQKNLDAKWARLYELEIDINEWPQLVMDNQDMFWDAAQIANYHSARLPRPRLLEFTEFQVNWSDRVSNTHCRPHNGVTNWGGQEKLKDGSPAPRGYPGWCGRIGWIVEWPKKYDGHYPGSDLFRSFGSIGRCRAHTGTGGGGHMSYNQKYQCHVQSFSYSFELFAADWPGMARRHEKNRVWSILDQDERVVA